MLKKLIFLTGVSLLSFTLLSCCSGEKTAKGNETDNAETPPYKATIPLPPNSADIKVTVTDISENADNLICKAKVEHVTGYGASTPQLPAGKEIEIHITKNAVKDLTINKNSSLHLRVSHFFSQGDEKDYWTFVQFIKE